MSSRGPIASGTDGTDFGARQRVSAHYQVIALTKKRLHFIMVLHLMLGVIMAIKLLPTLLDMLDIFWQDLEELLIPMAEPWEWAWLSTLAFVLVGIRALKTNNTRNLLVFVVGTVVFGILPLLYCASTWFADFKTFAYTRDASRTSAVWRNYPIALYWYVFITVAIQVHVLELYLCFELNRAFRVIKSATRRRRQD